MAVALQRHERVNAFNLVYVTFVGSNLRLDSMSQILTHCNVRSGSRLMVVESCNGLLLGAILERMAGICFITHETILIRMFGLTE